MTIIWITLTALIVVIAVGGGGALAFLNAQKKRSDRDNRFRAAILSRKLRIQGWSGKGGDNPEVYIAQREIQEIEKRYLEGKENPE